jgi:hypothetical protein
MRMNALRQKRKKYVRCDKEGESVTQEKKKSAQKAKQEESKTVKSGSYQG